MQFPVSAEFVETANPAQLHDEARGGSPEWPASFLQLDDESWVYRVDDVDEYVCDDPETGEPIECTRPREGVVIDAVVVQAALDNHVPVWPDPEPTIAELRSQIEDLRAQLGNL